jgi:ATP-binding cassette, subfamily B, bacterial MsbA
MKSIRFILNFLKPYKGLAVQNVGFSLLSALFGVFTLALLAPFLNVIFNNIQPAPDPGAFVVKTAAVSDFFHYIKDYGKFVFYDYVQVHGKVELLLVVCIIVFCASLFKNLFIFLANNCMATLRAYTVRDFRQKLYDKILRLPLSFFTEAHKGDIMTRVSNDVQEIESSVMASLTMLIRDPITIIVLMTYLFATSVRLTVFALVLLPISGLIIGRLSRQLRAKSFKGQQALGKLVSVLEETLSGLRVIKGFNGEEKMKKQFWEANNRYAKIYKRVGRKQYLSWPLSEFFATMVLLIVLYYGGSLALRGSENMAPATLIAYVAVFSQIIVPAKQISQGWFNVQKGMASVERMNFVLDADETISDRENAVEIEEFKDEIEFRNVWFAYGEEPVLKDINLKIKKGQTIAVVGRSGGGKSTLVDLLPRFIDPAKGEVLIDGHSVKNIKMHNLHKLMGIVSQQAILFNDSFKNNIAFGVNDAKDEDIVMAARIANAHEFIVDNQEGYEGLVGEGGNKLSGGQRQRISIARAVMANPPILILDEATSALDTESEKLVQDAMDKLMQNRTSIVIAHRLSTIQHADLIVVIEDGRIVETGKHEELLKVTDGIYQRLYKLQSF